MMILTSLTVLLWLWLIIGHIFFVKLDWFLMHLRSEWYSRLRCLIGLSTVILSTVISLSRICNVLSCDSLSVSHLSNHISFLLPWIDRLAWSRIILFWLKCYRCSLWSFQRGLIISLLLNWSRVDYCLLPSLRSFCLSPSLALLWWCYPIILTLSALCVLLFKLCYNSFFNIAKMCMLKPSQLNQLLWPNWLDITMFPTSWDDRAWNQIMISINQLMILYR
jgi:hypothetical protein